MKLFVFGFWEGFTDNTNPLGINVFIKLFSDVFQTDVELCDSSENSDILLETVFSQDTYLYKKAWKYSFLFSGESRLNRFYKDYSCVLYGERNHDHIINFPLFIPYLHSSNLLGACENPPVRLTTPPTKDVCVIISNPGGKERNAFLEKLERRNIQVDYAGHYKNNVSRCDAVYNTPEFIDFIRSYKFIVSMENSRGDTYITEKITHGFIANTIPIYWGSTNVGHYFNEERFINVKDGDGDGESVIDKIVELIKSPETYMNMIQKPVFTENTRTLDDVATDIRNVLYPGKYGMLNRIYAISSPTFEPTRWQRLQGMFQDTMNIPPEKCRFVCPTYKQTITPEIMNRYIKQNLIQHVRRLAMKKSEISLFLNYKAVLEEIQRNYSAGMFLIFESDVYVKPTDFKSAVDLCDFLHFMHSKNDCWDLAHIGSQGENEMFSVPYIYGETPYRQHNTVVGLPLHYIEDFTSETDKYRLVRKYHTRCTDSFLWNYTGVEKFLKYMNENPFYETPFDYYMCHFFETHPQFKNYWSLDSFFLQGSNYGIEPSTIQTDVE